MSKRLLAGVVATLVVSACGEYNFTPIPACESNQVLTGDGKALKCVAQAQVVNGGGGDGGQSGQPDASVERLVVPACPQGKCLTGDNTGSLVCVDVAMTNQMIANYEARITALENRVTNLEKNQGGGGKGGTYVGNSKANPQANSGKILYANAETGIAAAAAQCAADYGAGAHMCSAAEMYMSVATGVLTSKAAVAKAWVYAPSWQNPMGTPNQPLAGMADNCASYTYGTADQKWTGVAVEWKGTPSPQAQGAFALWWHGGAEAVCNLALPIACCK